MENQNSVTESVTKTAKIQVKLILTHVAAHLDEIVAIWVLLRFGSAKFEGFTIDKLRFVENDPEGGDVRYDAEGIIPIGVGYGRFDDKDSDGKRKPGVCAATLVATYFGLTGNRALETMLAETLRCDTKEGVTSTELAEIIKTSHRVLPGGNGLVVRWVMSALDAVYAQLQNQIAPGMKETGAPDLFRERQKNGDYTDERSAKSVERLFEHQGKSPFELDFAVRAMQRRGDSMADVREFANFAFERMYTDQERFHKCVDFVKKVKVNGRFRADDSKEDSFTVDFLAEIDGRRWTMRCLVLHTDAKQILRAANYRNKKEKGPARPYELLVIRHSTGHVQVFPHKSCPLPLNQMVAMIRWLDGDRTVKAQPWASLMEKGQIPTVPGWYYSDKNQLLNGSDSHSGVKPTGLMTKEIIDIVLQAFTSKDVNKWKGDRSIGQPNNRPENHNRPQGNYDNRRVEKPQERFQRGGRPVGKLGQRPQEGVVELRGRNNTASELDSAFPR